MDDQHFKNQPPTKLDFENFENPKYFQKTAKFLFCNVYRKKMFTIRIEDGREAPCNPSFYIKPIYDQRKLLPYVHVDDFINFKINFRRFHEMLCWNLF